MNGEQDLDYSVADTARRWAENYELIGIYPPRDNGEYPDGQLVLDFLAAAFPVGSLLEFGCGYGRLAHLWPATQYTGVDISATAIERARTRLPQHRFLLTDLEATLPPATAILAYAVLHHIPWHGLEALARRMTAAAPRILVMERMIDSPIKGTPRFPCWLRRPERYAELFAAQGFFPVATTHLDYKPYRGQTITALDLQRA